MRPHGEAKRGSGHKIVLLKSERKAPLPAPIAVETPRLPQTLAQKLAPILAAGVRDLVRRYALGALARRAVAAIAGSRPSLAAIEFSRRGDGIYESPPR